MGGYIQVVESYVGIELPFQPISNEALHKTDDSARLNFTATNVRMLGVKTDIAVATLLYLNATAKIKNVEPMNEFEKSNMAHFLSASGGMGPTATIVLTSLGSIREI